MNDSVKISFQQNEFAQDIKTSWQGLQIQNDFYDVTLACDKKQIEAHKLIISSHSPVLKHILRSNPNRYPVIYLRGVKFKDLENVVTFLYQGEINISEKDVENFVTLARDLKIKGLNKQSGNKIEEKSKSMENDSISVDLDKVALPVFDENTMPQFETDGSDKSMDNNEHFNELFMQEESKYDENGKISVDLDWKDLPMYNSDMLNIKGNFLVKDEDIHMPKKESDLNIEFQDGKYLTAQVQKPEEKTLRNLRMSKSGKIRRAVTKNAGKSSTEVKNPTVWTRDPSPERFVDGKKVKYICVTQANATSGPPYYCINCSYSSNEIINVKKHFRKHTSERPFGCKDCGKKYRASGAVLNHWNRSHNKEWKREFSCEICGYSFEFKHELNRHGIVHSGESFVCSVCGKGFKSPWQRDSHEAIHSSETVSCPICGKTFNNKQNVERHQERHEGKKYECDQCHNNFKTKGDVKVHKKIMHTSQSECKCVICGKTFKLKLYLNSHIKLVHEKSRQFKCLLCPKVLSSKDKFKRHSKRCHDGQLIPKSNRIK